MDGPGGVLAASLRRTGSEWGSRSRDVFSRSLWEEDDEEALKWATLEKLPTYDRIRTGILSGPQGAREVDVEDLDLTEKKMLMERLLRVADKDNEKLLKKLKNRLDRVGIQNPTIEVRFENLEIHADAFVGNRGVPTVLNFFTNKLEGLLNALHILPSKKKSLAILRGISGIIKPNRMTLLLGPPSSGKTALLLALAGKLNKNLKQ